MAKSSPMSTGDMAVLLDKQWHKIMLDEYSRYPREFPVFTKAMSSNESYESKYEMATDCYWCVYRHFGYGNFRNRHDYDEVQ